jgi:uncharacterized alpha-E superfamily protein
MNRAAGWRFLEMGRRAERAINTTRFARQFAYDEAGDEDLDVLLTLVDCQITYRSRYLVQPLLTPVRDLAVLDPYNPRSVAFQVAALNEHIAALPRWSRTCSTSPMRSGCIISRTDRTPAGRRSSRGWRDLRHPSRHDLQLRDPGQLRALLAAAGAAQR